jgi:signal transduction histidine kinase
MNDPLFSHTRLRLGAVVLMVEAASLLRPTLGEQIEIEWMLADEAWPALADRSQLVTAVLNIVINARDTMPGGGKLTLETVPQDRSRAHDPHGAGRRGNANRGGARRPAAVSSTTLSMGRIQSPQWWDAKTCALGRRAMSSRGATST